MTDNDVRKATLQPVLDGLHSLGITTELQAAPEQEHFYGAHFYKLSRMPAYREVNDLCEAHGLEILEFEDGVNHQTCMTRDYENMAVLDYVAGTLSYMPPGG